MTVRRSAFVIYSATPTLKDLPINASTGQTFGKKLEGRQKGRADQSALLLLTRQMPVYEESENYPTQSGSNGEISQDARRSGHVDVSPQKWTREMASIVSWEERLR